MNKARWVSATAGAAMIAATLVLPTAGVAYASGHGHVTSNGNASGLSGDTIDAPASLPADLCDVSLGIIGFANSGCDGGATSDVSTDPSGDGDGYGNGNIGLDSGDTVTAPNCDCTPPASPPNCDCTPPATPPTCDCTPPATPPASPPASPPTCHCTPPTSPPACHGDQCRPCHGNQCTCHGDCTPPPGGTPPGTTTTVTKAIPPGTNLPTTGANLLLLGVAAVGTIGVGAGAVTLTRRRRNDEAA